jgi:hypothetical protein
MTREGMAFERDARTPFLAAIAKADAHFSCVRKQEPESLDGQVLGVLGESGKQLKQFGWVHEIACPSENGLYVAELLNWRVQRLLLHPQK